MTQLEWFQWMHRQLGLSIRAEKAKRHPDRARVRQLDTARTEVANDARRWVDRKSIEDYRVGMTAEKWRATRRARFGEATTGD